MNRDGASLAAGKFTFRRRQRGLTLIGFLMLMGLVGFVALFAVRVGPIYFDHYLIRTTIDSLQKDPDLHSKTREEILGLLRNRWDINNIETVKDKDIKITREDGAIKLHLKYDVARNVFGNLDVLVHFDDLFLIESKR